MPAPPPPPSAFHPTSDTTRIFGLDAMRAAAILSVVGAHALKVFYPHCLQIGLLGHGGFYGVELFFVLSGFLIGQIMIRLGPGLGEASTLGVFYVRRWFRTLPLFWLFVAVNVWLEWRFNHRSLEPGEIFEHAFFLRTFAANHISFIPESFSLAIEEWFYLLFPAALWFALWCRARFAPALLGTAAVFYLFSTVGRVVSAVHLEGPWTDWQRVLVIYRFDALMTGIVAAWLAHRFPAAWRRHARVLAIVGALLALAMYASLWRPARVWVAPAPDDFFARTFRFNLVSLGFALLLPAMSGWTLRAETFVTTTVRKIALWSYGLYLVHQPVIRLCDRYFFPEWKTSALQAAAAFATQLGAAIFISAILYHFYEAPFTRLREKAAPLVAHFFRPHAAKL